MDSEDNLFRLPHRPHTNRLIPQFFSAGARRHDCTIAPRRAPGKRPALVRPKNSSGNGTVAYVVAPRQHMTWGNYSITAEALAEVVYVARRLETSSSGS